MSGTGAAPPDDEALHVVAATSVRAVETIDGGDAMAVRMTTAGGGELCVLLPTGAVGEMLFLLAEAVGAGHDQG